MNAHAEAGIGHNSITIGEMVKDEPAVVYRDETVLPALVAEISAEIAALPVDLKTASGRAVLNNKSVFVGINNDLALSAGKCSDLRGSSAPELQLISH